MPMQAIVIRDGQLRREQLDDHCLQVLDALVEGDPTPVFCLPAQVDGERLVGWAGRNASPNATTRTIGARLDDRYVQPIEGTTAIVALTEYGIRSLTDEECRLLENAYSPRSQVCPIKEGKRKPEGYAVVAGLLDLTRWPPPSNGAAA
jgi:hypothetical protein